MRFMIFFSRIYFISMIYYTRCLFIKMNFFFIFLELFKKITMLKFAFRWIENLWSFTRKKRNKLKVRVFNKIREKIQDDERSILFLILLYSCFDARI